jgi:phospholipase/carboxylesterase
MKGLSLAAALALTACGAGDPPGAEQKGAAMDARALHQRGILTARPHPPSRPTQARGRQVLLVGAEARGLLFVPAPRAAPPGVLLLLHGARGRAERIIARFEPAAEKLGLLLVAPESSGLTWDLIEGKAFGADVTAIDEALAAVFDRHAVDGERVAVGGFSDGASYALSLGLGNGQLFRAIIAYSPGFASSARVAGRPRVFMSHGRRDSVLPIEKTSHRIAPMLERLGLDVRFVEFPGEHEIPDHILDAGLSLVAPR